MKQEELEETTRQIKQSLERIPIEPEDPMQGMLQWLYLTEIKRNKLTPEQIQVLCRTTNALLDSMRPRRAKFEFFIDHGMKKSPFKQVIAELKTPEKLEEMTKVAIEHLNNRGGRYLISKIVMENFGRLPELSKIRDKKRLFIKNAGDTLEPLGGRLIGILARKMPIKSFEAWKKAHETKGLLTEEIMKRKNGEYRMHKIGEGNAGTAVVFTEDSGGERLDIFVEEKPHYEGAIRKLQERALKRLTQIKVGHGHAHDENFMVELTKKGPRVRIIDFGMAEITTREHAGIRNKHIPVPRGCF
ncbi:hypothetical protein HZC09_05950 [Candidatus Micrarchaeota archaeon]|nr:hypothetical protein [Candidatus Micrarchaeota archaeon]